MARTRRDIVQDLLKSANYYWYDDNHDHVAPIDPEDFDPVVDKIFKANAVELEKLHAEVEDARRSVVLGLAKSLAPDQSLLPEPGYTVAQIRPNAARIDTTPEDRYQISGQSDTGTKHDYYFTPLFEHNFPKCTTIAILTENMAMQVVDNTPEICSDEVGFKTTSSIWLGLEIEKHDDNDLVSFFLGNRIVDEFDKDYDVFHRAKWWLDGTHELTVTRGIKRFAKARDGIDPSNALLEALQVPKNYEAQINNRFRNDFIHIALPKNTESFRRRVPTQVSAGLTNQLKIKEPLYWIRIDFTLPIPSTFLIEHPLYSNVIPLVNRRMKENYVVKSNYDRIVLPLRTTDLFLDMHRVQDTKDKGTDSSYQEVDFLHPNSRPGTFMLRGGARVRRLNREDASQQIHRLLEVIRDEYNTFKEEGVNRLREDFEIIEKAMNRIKTQLPDYFREKPHKETYFCIANFKSGVSRLHYSYWETQGDEIKHLGNKRDLTVTSNDVRLKVSKSIIPIQRGKGALSADDYINQVKTALLSGGWILSRGDIAMYCRNRYGHYVSMVGIERQLMMVQKGELGRGILVTLKPIIELSKEEVDFIRVELQNDLNAKSAFFAHIKVEIRNEK